MTLWSWQRVYGAPVDKILDPRATPTIDRLSRECIEGPLDLVVRQRTEKPLEQYFLTTKGPAEIERWRSLLAKNTPTTLPPEIPVFLAQGDKDAIVSPEATRSYAAELCNAGSKVAMLILPNIGHGRAAQASTHEAISWLGDRFADAQPPNNCDVLGNDKRSGKSK
ncbi:MULTISPECIES: alpha/beta hydrolase family protein [Bradyrhizobium]|uniref:alpha/beta hydrolase family protein n=1 Tax=Bradyrhizobium elkanii TaxID=29448 RepID=UPI000404BEC2|nr:lipase family protein [Bradyrhizobium elkanii]